MDGERIGSSMITARSIAFAAQYPEIRQHYRIVRLRSSCCVQCLMMRSLQVRPIDEESFATRAVLDGYPGSTPYDP